MGLGLLIGGNGYVGSFLQNHLNVDVMDAGWYGSTVSESLYPADYDYVIMLAGHASIWLCDAEPEESWANNVDEFRALIDSLPVGLPLIYASSGSVYGHTERNAIERDTPSAPIANYDLQKLTVDLIAEHAITQGHRIMGLRFGTVNGLSPHTRTDLMVNSMVNSVLETGTLKAGNVDKRRALLFLDDLVAAINLMLKKPVAGIYNLASTNITVGEVADVVAKQLNVDVEHHEFVNPFSFGLDCSKFKCTFGDYGSTPLATVVDNLSAGLRTVRKTRRDQLP